VTVDPVVRPTGGSDGEDDAGREHEQRDAAEDECEDVLVGHTRRLAGRSIGGSVAGRGETKGLIGSPPERRP
jgi:hypothetical protein